MLRPISARLLKPSVAAFASIGSTFLDIARGCCAHERCQRVCPEGRCSAKDDRQLCAPRNGNRVRHRSPTSPTHTHRDNTPRLHKATHPPILEATPPSSRLLSIFHSNPSPAVSYMYCQCLSLPIFSLPLEPSPSLYRALSITFTHTHTLHTLSHSPSDRTLLSLSLSPILTRSMHKEAEGCTK